MTNVEMKVEGEKLIITIDLTKTYGLSKKGKSKTVASTGGFIGVPNHPTIALNLNVNDKNIG